MGRIEGLRRLFRLPASNRTVGRDVEDEITFHLESRAAELESRGLPSSEARRRAEREFGDVAAARAELSARGRAGVRRSRRAAWLEAAGHEIRLAARGLGRAPGFTAAVVVMLALGIGVNAAMFGLADRLLLSPPAHVQDGDRLVRVLSESTPPWTGELTATATLPYADYAAFRDGVSAFEAVAGYTHPAFSVLGSGLEAMELRVVGATASYFPMLGVAPAVGRFFTAEEAAEPRGENVAVLSHALWRSQFGRDPAILGRELEIDNRTFTVIGVAPRGFHGVDLEPVQAWIPISATTQAAQSPDWPATRWLNWVRIVGRLRSEASPEVAAAQATSVYLAAEDYQQRYADDPTARIVTGSIIAARAPAVGQGTPQRSGRIALWLLGVSTVVLVIACVNVANLLLARGIRRRRETGVRLAMGIGRGRLGGHVLAETLLIAIMAGLLGLLLAHVGGELARLVLMPDFDWPGSPVDGRVLGFAGAAAVAAALVAGLIPALHAARSDVIGLLSLGGRGGTYRRSRLRSGLVMLQATLSVILLVAAGLFVRSLHNARTVALGYEPGRVALFTWHTSGLDWSAARVHEVYDASLERVLGLPDVEAAGLSLTSPMWSSMGAGLRVPGRDSVPTPPGMAGFMWDAVSPDYFRTLGTRVIRGRGFTDADVAGSTPVLIVTQAFADWVWPGEDAVGKCVVHVQGSDPPCREVVGVVENVRYRHIEAAPDVMLFRPLAQGPPYPVRILTVRTHGDPERAMASVRAALVGMQSGLPPVQARLLRHQIDPQLQPWRLGASLFSAFGVLALLLAALGLYGVVAYDVAQRRRELGVRAALGARARHLMSLVMGDAFRVVGLGLVLGVAVALWAAPRVEMLLFDVAPRDGTVFGAVALLLLLAAGIAALLPGLRAVRVEPAEALRED
jgi:putative ABC transport system permease protein